MKIFITGAAGYIGSHATLYALKNGYDVIAFDSLERGFKESIDRIQNLTQKNIKFIKGDLRNIDDISNALQENLPDIIFHFAAYKSVGEGEIYPERYYQNNVEGSLNLLETMKKLGIPKIIFSSTSAIYGNNPNVPFTEDTPASPISIYAKTKLKLEEIVQKYVNENGIKAISFRYFNVIGADESGQIGEDPKTSTNLLSVVTQVLIGNRESVSLFGNKFKTKDGSQERDYIHVEDIVNAHFKAIDYNNSDFEIFNLSTGSPTSCLEIFKIAEEITGRKLNYIIVEPRKGDPEVSYAISTKAKKLLNWSPKYNIEQSISSYWNWVVNNPKGYSY